LLKGTSQSVARARKLRRVMTLRIPATTVLKDMDSVMATILAAVQQRLPLHHAAHGPPPPQVGEDFLGAL
jgi:hypothetical protein